MGQPIQDVIKADPRKPGTYCLWTKDQSRRIRCGFGSRVAAEAFEKKLKQIIAIRKKDGHDKVLRATFGSLTVTNAIAYETYR